MCFLGLSLLLREKEAITLFHVHSSKLGLFDHFNYVSCEYYDENMLEDVCENKCLFIYTRLKHQWLGSKSGIFLCRGDHTSQWHRPTNDLALFFTSPLLEAKCSCQGHPRRQAIDSNFWGPPSLI